MRKLVLALILIILVVIIGFLSSGLFTSVISEDENNLVMFVYPNNDLDEVKEELLDRNWLRNEIAFRFVSDQLHYDKPRPGKYLMEPGMTLIDVIRRLRSGGQEPVNITFSSGRTIHDVAGQVSDDLLIDSAALTNALLMARDTGIFGYGKDTFLTLFIPNTYEVYWTISPERFLNRMKIEHERYWAKQSKSNSIEDLGLSAAEIYTLASIVEKESNAYEDRRNIAGVYLNRLERGMPLQADPTVVHAVGDFDMRRVLKKHLEVESPYNTYKYPGLPPGPICIPSQDALDATLNAVNHDYLYFCARPDSSGLHAFARTLGEHNRNARQFHNWLNKRGIK